MSFLPLSSHAHVEADLDSSSDEEEACQLYQRQSKKDKETGERLCQMARDGDFESLRSTLPGRNAAATANCRDRQGRTPLMVAASCGMHKIADELLQREAQVDAVDDNGRTALHWAIEFGWTGVARLLLDARRNNSNIVNMSDSDGCSPLMLAARRDSGELTKLLLDCGADVTYKNRRNRGALQEAEDHNCLEVIDLLRKRIDDFTNYRKIRAIGPIENLCEMWEVRTDRRQRLNLKIVRLQCEAEDPTTDNMVIEKVKEAQILREMRHPNILRFVKLERGNPAEALIFTEFVKGKALNEVIREEQLGLERIRHFCRQITDALRYMHGMEPPVLHRNIKCENIMVGRSDSVKVVDFGVATQVITSTTRQYHVTNNKYGTENFMAPEVIAGDQAEYSPASDIWAFGCTIYQMVTGEAPYQNTKNTYHLTRSISNSGAPALPPKTKEDLKDFYNCCTDSNRERRSKAKDLMRHKFLSPVEGEYRNDGYQGHCLVVNVNDYKNDKNATRTGSKKDVQAIVSLFGDLDFEMTVEENLQGDIMKVIKDAARRDHSEANAFVCFLMGHGRGGSIYGHDSTKYKISDLARELQVAACPELQGKPKIFFVQACRGLDEDKHKVSGRESQSRDSAPTIPEFEIVCPDGMDFLFCFATTKGANAYRDPIEGSMFIQEVCGVIRHHHQKEHLETMMGIVRDKLQKKPFTTQDGQEGVVVVPETRSTLTRQVWLSPKTRVASASRN